MPTVSRRSWIWFFVILVVLTATSIGIQIWYNQGRQLTMEKLKDAQAKWKEHHIRDYDLEYTAKKGESGDEVYQVRVRGGKVVEVVRNGKPLEERLHHYHDMPALFGFIEDYLRLDDEAAKNGTRRPFLMGDFHPELGYLRRFVRSVNATRERIEIIVSFKLVNDNATAARASA